MHMDTKKHIRRQLFIMSAIVIGMFAFCYALVPIYNVFCKVTGLNGKTGGQVAAVQGKIDTSRTVTVELLATLNYSFAPTQGEFSTQIKKFTLHPGEYVKTSYWVKNLRAEPVIVQAIPSVTPGLGASYIKKVECFCYTRQPLAPFEGKDMPLVFTVSPELPTSIQTLSLAYTLYDVTTPSGAH